MLYYYSVADELYKTAVGKKLSEEKSIYKTKYYVIIIKLSK
jgi:hypothetical protein